MSWIDNALADLASHEASVEARLNAFFSHMHNEVAHSGAGATAAQDVTAEACARSDEIAAAVGGAKVEPATDGSAAPPPPGKPVAGIVTA